MSLKHIFKAALSWQKKENAPTKSIKSHTISIVGKEQLDVSAAKAFKGDPELLNPEDLLLSSLVSCHMMAYLYVCSQHQIEVLSYTDNAQGILETSFDGGGKFIAVHLAPQVIIANAAQIDLALSLHQQANKLCFIANSCNFPLTHQPSCTA